MLWSCHACIEFEKRGIPSTVIVTHVFETHAHALLKSWGYPDVPVLVTPSPVVFRSDADVQERVNNLLTKVAESLRSPVAGERNA